jgi:hypothetical protein
MANPNGDKTALIFIANGEPTHKAVTNTDKGGMNGRIAAQSLGRKLHSTKTHEVTKMIQTL